MGKFEALYNKMVTEAQMSDSDAAYMELAKDPEKNKEELQRMVDDAAKRNGYTIGPVYHGTIAMFKEFDLKKIGRNDLGLWGRGFYFTKSLSTAISYATRQGDGSRIISAFVSLKNPLVLKTGKDLITRLPDGRNTKDLIGYGLDGSKIKDIAIKGNHDGVIQLRPNGEIGDLVVYAPSQIKSADPVTYDDKGNIIPLSKRFNNFSINIMENKHKLI